MAENQPNEEVACDTCGKFGAVSIADRQLCPDCFAESGTCGAGGGEDMEP